MMEFMQNFVIVSAFIVIVVTLGILGTFAGIEVYDRITGADAKKQAQLDRLRRLEEEDDF